MTTALWRMSPLLSENGGALGIMQIEESTYNSLMNNSIYKTRSNGTRFLAKPKELKALEVMFGKGFEFSEIQNNDAMSIVFARKKYSMAPARLPNSTSLKLQAEYWGSYYQTTNDAVKIKSFKTDYYLSRPKFPIPPKS